VGEVPIGLSRLGRRNKNPTKSGRLWLWLWLSHQQDYIVVTRCAEDKSRILIAGEAVAVVLNFLKNVDHEDLL
jgi:hypothetical protein